MARINLLKGIILLALVALAAGGRDLSSPRRALLKRGRGRGGDDDDSPSAPVVTPAPTHTPTRTPTLVPVSSVSTPVPTHVPTPTPTPAPAGGGAVSQAPTAAASTAAPPPPAAPLAGRWDPSKSPLGPLATPAGNECPALGEEVRGYPGTFFNVKPFVFTKPFKPLHVKSPSLPLTCENGLCINTYEFTISEFMADYNFTGTPCAGVPSLGFDGRVPGPLVIAQVGIQDFVRFRHNVSVTSKYFPPAGPRNGPEGHGEADICKNRAVRNPGNPAGTGRGFSIHHHGMASLSIFDGWADQYFCSGETRDYVVPNNRAGTLYYHDHAVGITSENTYNGLSGMRITRPCDGHDPFEVENGRVEEHHLLLGDMVLARPRAGEAGVCRRMYDRKDLHSENLWGDINTVNGVPWPVLDVRAKFHRFRILNAASSRPFLLSFKDKEGKDVSDKCSIIGGDGGTTIEAIKMPSGMMVDVAYRYDIVCDLRGFEDETVYLYNEHDAGRTTSETPYFCYSHLVMKINVGEKDGDAHKPDLSATTRLEQSAALPKDLLAGLEKRALRGEADRELKFAKSSNVWDINDRTWDSKLSGKPQHVEWSNVGVNNVELWLLKSGGGWIHPVHIHLVDFFCLAMKGDEVGSGWQSCPPELKNVPKDVQHIGADVREVILAARYGPHIGEYMMHCHNTVHEDSDMMRAFLVVDAEKGLTFSRTPSFNYTALAGSPLSINDSRGDSFDMTFRTGSEPTADKAYAKALLKKAYYSIFFPKAGSYLSQPQNNMWLTTCGTGQPDTDPLPTAAPTSEPAEVEDEDEDEEEGASSDDPLPA